LPGTAEIVVLTMKNAAPFSLCSHLKRGIAAVLSQFMTSSIENLFQNATEK